MTTQITTEQILEQVMDILLELGVDSSLIEPSRALIAGESTDAAFIQGAGKQAVQVTQEIAGQVFKLHAVYGDEDLRETVTLGCFVLYWLTGFAWVLPQAERVRLEAAQSLARLGLNGEQLVHSQLYMMGETDETDWWSTLPHLDLDQLSYDPHWTEYVEMYNHLRAEATEEIAERYFAILYQIGGIPSQYFETSKVKARRVVVGLLQHMDLDRTFILRCVDYVLGEADDTLLQEDMPHVNLGAVPAHAWDEAEAGYEVYRMSHGQGERERMLRWFHLLHHLGGTELFQYLWPAIQKGRVILLEKLFAFDPKRYGPVLVEHLEDPAKAVRERMIELLSRYRGADEEVQDMVWSKDHDAREAAVLIISAWNDEKFQPLLAEVLAVEKNESVRKTLLMLVKGGLPIPEKVDHEEIIETREQFENYVWKHMRPIQKEHLTWLDLHALPTIRYRDSEEVADEAARRYLMLSYVVMRELKRNKEAEKVAAFLNQADIADLAYELQNLWFDDSEKKKRWVLYFSAAHGDERSVARIMQYVPEWPKDGKHGHLAIDAVRALAMRQERSSLKFVDSVARKFRFPSVKKAAASAFEFVEEQYGIDAEVLFDQVVPDLGFDANGEQVIQYGSRTFTLRLTPDLAISLHDESGKTHRFLPKPEAGDGEAQANAVKEELSALRKQLKEEVATQTLRMEKALATKRKWTVEKWNELFMENPIMLRLATGMTFGAYVDDVLHRSFQVLEDRSLQTQNGEAYVLPENAVIGLVWK